MSFFIGVYGNTRRAQAFLEKVCPDPAFQVEGESFHIRGGGPDRTFHSEHTPETGTGWVSCGIGISRYPDPRYLTQKDWSTVIRNGPEALHKLNGHFAVLSWEQGKITVQTDRLGIRSVFIAETEDYTLFSTRLDWIMEAPVPFTLDLKRFGSSWTAVNAFNHHSFIGGLKKLGQGGQAIIDDTGVQISHKPFTPDDEKSYSPEECMHMLQQFSSISLREGNPLSLGLSGGLDSRLLLALLTSEEKELWTTHTFSIPGHPDSRIAEEISNLYPATHRSLEIPELEARTIAEEGQAFVIQNQLTTALGKMEEFSCYRQLHEIGTDVIDGGFGEIGRRRFLFKLEKKLKSGFSKPDLNAESLLPFFHLHRADIFNDSVQQILRQGAEQDLQELIHTMPEVHDTGLDGWLDLLTIRSRIPNAAGPEQGRSDAELFNYMPYLQPQFIEAALQLPVNLRSNAKLYRSVIKKSAPELTRFNLVKGLYSYPYAFRDLPAAVWIRMKKKLSPNQPANRQAQMLYRLEEFVQDRFASAGVQSCELYGRSKIHHILNEFYTRKNEAYTPQLNWLLSFELFREKTPVG